MTSLRNNKSTTVVVSLTLTCTRSQFFSISRASFLVESHSRVKDLFCRWLPGVLRAPSPEDVAPRGRGGVEALRIAGGEAEVRARDPSIDAIPRIPSLPREHPLDIPFLGASRSAFPANARRSPTHLPNPRVHIAGVRHGRRRRARTRRPAAPIGRRRRGDAPIPDAPGSHREDG